MMLAKDLETNRIVGGAEVCFEALSLLVAEDFRNLGIATQLARAIIDLYWARCFKGLLTARALRGNFASRRVLEKLEFKITSTQHMRIAPNQWDTIVFFEYRSNLEVGVQPQMWVLVVNRLIQLARRFARRLWPLMRC